MAQTDLITSISRTDTFPIEVSVTCGSNCGTLSLILDNSWTDQMIHELPTLNITAYTTDGNIIMSFDVNMTTVNTKNLEATPIESYTIPIYNLPSDVIFKVTPLFDTNALEAHNEEVKAGNIKSFNTTESGIVNTDINDYSSELWTTPTSTFNVTIIFDDSNIVPGGGSGGGSGSDYTQEVIWSAATSTDPSGEFTLSKSITNFDEIVFSGAWSLDGTTYRKTNSILVTDLEKIVGENAAVEVLENDVYYMYCRMDTDTHFIYIDGRTIGMDAIYGIKYGSGGGGGGGSTTPSAADVSFTPTQTLSSTNVQAAIEEVDDKVTNLPEPMIFKGSLGTGGTITTLPTASDSNKGFTYKVITAGTYQGVECKVGDTVISDGTAWVLIPSGDEPSGTVTNVAVTSTDGSATITGSPVTSSGTIDISVNVDSALNNSSTKPVQNQVITACLTPMTQQQYEALQSYDYPLYYIYET